MEKRKCLEVNKPDFFQIDEQIRKNKRCQIFQKIMAWILRRLPGAGLLREAWHATQLQGAIHEKKRAERALVLAEQNAQIGEFYIDIFAYVLL